MRANPSNFLRSFSLKLHRLREIQEPPDIFENNVRTAIQTRDVIFITQNLNPSFTRAPFLCINHLFN